MPRRTARVLTGFMLAFGLLGNLMIWIAPDGFFVRHDGYRVWIEIVRQ